MECTPPRTKSIPLRLWCAGGPQQSSWQHGKSSYLWYCGEIWLLHPLEPHLSWASSQMYITHAHFTAMFKPHWSSLSWIILGFWPSASTRFLLIPFSWFFIGLLFLLRSHLKCYLLREAFSDYPYLFIPVSTLFFWRYSTIWYELIYLVVSYNTVS